MLTMPPKPMKRLEARLEDDGSYTVRFITPLRNESHFERIMQNEITPCLGEHDSISEIDWETRSFVLVTDNLRAFQYRLLKRMFIVQKG